MGNSTTRDDAFSYTKSYRKDGTWWGQTFYVKGNVLQSEGSYKENNTKYPIGTFKNYSSKGILLNVSSYNDTSKLTECIYYSPDGQKRAMIYLTPQGYGQKCWDSAGNESNFCKIETQASFKGGQEGWARYLQQNLRANVAGSFWRRVGTYTVTVKFIIDKEGKVRDVEAVSVPDQCKACAKEAIRVISKSPAWIPASINGENVPFSALQNVQFKVE